MKVEDLIAQLSQLPEGTEIHFEGYEDDEAEDLITELVSDCNTFPETGVNCKVQSWELLPLKDKPE